MGLSLIASCRTASPRINDITVRTVLRDCGPLRGGDAGEEAVQLRDGALPEPPLSRMTGA